ncbi:MAG: hypothetical protein N2490_09465 [Ignavibacteria bacterium]|nr:hypothetical protein [Ignavibacteria bacterium]
MEKLNGKIDNIFEKGILEVYKVNVYKNFEDTLYDRINLQEKFIQEDIKTFRIVKLISSVLLVIIIISLIVGSIMVISQDELILDPKIESAVHFLNDTFLFLFSIIGLRTESNLYLIFLISYVFLLGLMFIEKITSKKRS